MHFPSWFSEPLKLSFDAWKDDTDSLGSLLEVFKWAGIAGAHGIFPSVFVGQIFHESNLGLSQSAILGIKARQSDIKNGTFKRLKTREVLTSRQVDALKTAGDFISVEKVYPDGLIEVKCYQLFHYKEGLADDFEELLNIYERYWNKYNKPKVTRSWTPRDFLEKVTQGPPAYATGKEYVDLVMGHIERFKLASLDAGFPYAPRS
jgi:hypothetical protein